MSLSEQPAQTARPCTKSHDNLTSRLLISRFSFKLLLFRLSAPLSCPLCSSDSKDEDVSLCYRTEPGIRFSLRLFSCCSLDICWDAYRPALTTSHNRSKFAFDFELDIDIDFDLA